MILEVAMLGVRPGRGAEFEKTFGHAQSLLATMVGYRSHELRRCLEAPDRYVLLVAHGDVGESGGKKMLRDGYSWLLSARV